MLKLKNAIFFQIIWFACVVGSAHDLVWPAFLCCAAFVFWQLMPQHRHPNDLTLIVIACIIGLIIDSAWIHLGFLQYKHTFPHPSISPLWIIILWVAFALTINHSLSWLKKHPILPTLMGIIGAPFSYIAGEKLGAINVASTPIIFLSCLALAWALALNLLCYKNLPKLRRPNNFD